MIRAVGIAAALVISGCGTAGHTVNPDETSAERHRAEAEHEHAAADRERSRYDPAATSIDRTLPLQAWDARGPEVAFTNPTEAHLNAAVEHREHALAHERAAAELEHFEATECKGVPARERAACPLLAPVTAIRDLPNGVRVELASARVGTLLADMRCHWAFARARGFSAEAAACPLYIRGIVIEGSPDGQAIEIKGRTPAIVGELRRRVRQEALFAR